MQLHEIGVFRFSILDPSRYRAALRIVREFRPHIVHGAVFEGTATAMVAGDVGRVPVRIAEETHDPVNRSWRGNFLARTLYSRAHAVIACAPAVAEYLKRIGVPERKIVLVASAVRARRPVGSVELEQRRTELGLRPGDLVLGTVCRLLDHHKRVSDLIEALILVGASIPTLKLLVVGDGPDRAMLETLARDRGVAERCVFAGYQHDTDLYYAMMDIFALVSSYE